MSFFWNQPATDYVGSHLGTGTGLISVLHYIVTSLAMDNAATGAGGNVPSVLLVEDEFLIRYDLAEQMRDCGWAVLEAGSAAEATDVIRSSARIDLVVTDMRMPGEGDGLDVARAVRNWRSSVRVVMISAHMQSDDLPIGLIDLFLPKPLQENWLQEVASLLDGDEAAVG